jgi:hypothetical protein
MQQGKYRFDILHIQYILPIPIFSVRIVTIHDILFETYPQFLLSLFLLRAIVLMRLSAGCTSQVLRVAVGYPAHIKESIMVVLKYNE